MTTKLTVYNHKKISSSTIKTFVACPRKWYFQAFHKHNKPVDTSSAASRLGTECHLILQRYLDGEELIESTYSSRAWNITQRNIETQWLPKKCLTETPFKLAGIKGEIDVIVPPSARTKKDLRRFGTEGKIPLVMDHKTTASIRLYALTSDKLMWDRQAMVYANYCLHRYKRANHIDLLWNYMETKSGLQKQITCRVSREHVESYMSGRVYPVVQEMKKLLETEEVHISSFKQELSECDAYGGCPYIDVCNPNILVPEVQFEKVIAESRGIGRVLLLKGTSDKAEKLSNLMMDVKKVLRNAKPRKVMELTCLKWSDGLLEVDVFINKADLALLKERADAIVE